MTPTTFAADALSQSVSGIRNAKIEHAREGQRAKCLTIISGYSEMLPIGETLSPHHVLMLANMLSLAYSVGRLDGMRDMVDDTPTGGRT